MRWLWLLLPAAAAVATLVWWWRQRRPRPAPTSWRIEGVVLPGWEIALEVARAHLPDWTGPWGGVVEGRAERISAPYGGARDGTTLDADEPRIAVVNVRVIPHECWHVNEARHGRDRDKDPPAAWEGAALADLDARLAEGG